MKTLPFIRGPNNRITVECATGEVAIHIRCAYCKHCAGIRIAKRLTPSPLVQTYEKLQRGRASDQDLLTAAMMFNQLIEDPRAEAIECADEKGTGFSHLSAR